MALYLVSYDINEKDKDEYEGLWTELRHIGAVKILYSEWAIVADTGMASSLYDRIAPQTKLPDRLLVQELTKDARWDKVLISDADFRKLLLNARG